MHATDTLAEADRLMTVCNSCRYCEGLCAVFPAMERRRAFAEGDLNFLANLCHSCGACYVDCQFSPPHEFDVNLPRTLTALRADSWARYAWPAALQPLFRRNGLFIAIAAAVGVAGFLIGFVAWNDPGALTKGGDFYRLMPHTAMAGLFGLATLYTVVALFMSFRNFWRDIGTGEADKDTKPLLQAVHEAATLRYLDGGGVGCFNEDDRPTDRRRLYHHLTFYGFLLCFAATCAGTFYHYVLGIPAPYPWYALPKVFGVPGGLALVIGTTGLMYARTQRDPMLADKVRNGMDRAFTLMLFLTGLSGLLLWLLRSSPAMGVLLAVHLGVVLALFLTMPYGRFVHGLYRFGALVKNASEERAQTH